MRLTAWSSIAVAGVLLAVTLSAAPDGLAGERGGAGPGVQERGPAAASAAGSLAARASMGAPRADASSVRAQDREPTTGLQAAGDGNAGSSSTGVPLTAADKGTSATEPEYPLQDTTVARLRLKDFVRQAYALRDANGPSESGGMPLVEALARIDALPAEQVDELDARLAPAIWVTRGLAIRETDTAPDDLASPAQGADPEALRKQIDDYLARFQPYATLAGADADVYARLISTGREKVAAMTDEELLGLLDLFASLPSARAVLDVDPATILGPPPGRSFSSIDGLGGDASARVLAGSIHTNSSCADMAFGPVVTVTFRALAEAADDIAELLSDDYMATTFNIPDIAKIVAKTIALAIELLAIPMEADMDYFENCNDNAHMSLFVEHDAETTNRMGEIDSLLEDGSRSSDFQRVLDNRMDRIDTFNAEYRDLTLRLAIEKDLVRHGDPRIALFQVPASVCVTTGEHASCGQLETVREIVADTILMNRSAGFDTSLASVALADGDEQMGLGLYKAAYTRFRYAYQLAVRSK